jgi:hypothetical protein
MILIIIRLLRYWGNGILIYTGKTKYPLDERINIKPDFEAHSLRNVIEILAKEV